MKVCIASRYKLTGDALQFAVANMHPDWQVSTYVIRHAAFGKALLERLEKEKVDLILIEVSSAHWPFYMEGLQEIQEKWPISLLIDEPLENVLSTAKQLGITNIKLKNEALEVFAKNLGKQTAVGEARKVERLQKDELKVLSMLCAGHSIEFICRKLNLTATMLDQHLLLIFQYLDVADCPAAIKRAFDLNIIGYE